MAQGLTRLWHDAVIRRHHEHHNVGDIRTPRPHLGKRGVTRGVNERDRVTIVLNAVSTNVLRDATRLTSGDPRLAQRIQKRCLAMVNVTHESDDRSAQLEFLLLHLLRHLSLRFHDHLLNLVHTSALLALLTLQLETVLLANLLRHIDLDVFVRARHEHLKPNQIRNHLEGLQAHPLSQFLDNDRRLQMNDLLSRLIDLKLRHLFNHYRGRYLNDRARRRHWLRLPQQRNRWQS